VAACAGAACSGTQNIALGVASVTISDGPHLYADNADCRWVVTAAGPISLYIQSFEIDDYSYDFVKVYAGEIDDDYDFYADEDESEAPLHMLTGVLAPTLLSTNATSLTIVFLSDRNYHLSGFVIELSTVQPGGTWAPSHVPSAAPTWSPASGVPVAWG
jgi:hypothetical protein